MNNDSDVKINMSSEDKETTISQDNSISNKQVSKDTLNNIYESLGISNAGHPLLCLIHLFVKGFTFFVYIFFGIIFSSTTIFFITSCLCVIDFWIVKNISGRFSQ